jgi:hypothetical protein
MPLPVPPPAKRGEIEGKICEDSMNKKCKSELVGTVFGKFPELHISFGLESRNYEHLRVANGFFLSLSLSLSLCSFYTKGDIM